MTNTNLDSWNFKNSHQPQFLWLREERAFSGLRALPEGCERVEGRGTRVSQLWPHCPSVGLSRPQGCLLSQGETEVGGHWRDGPHLNLTAWGFPISSGNLNAFAKEPLKSGYGRRWCGGVKKRKRSVCSLISQHMAPALSPSMST